MFQNSNLNKPTIEGQMEKITGASNRIDEIMKEQADMYRPKTDAEIKAKFEKQNKEAIQRLRDRKNKPLDPNDVLPDYNETPGAFTRRNTPGSKENLLQELKIAYEKDFNKLRGDETVEELQSILKNLDKNGEPFADGGRIGLLAGSVPKIPAVISRLLKNKKKVEAAVNDIFPTGDYKYDAQMTADAIVENNPKTFKGMLYEDLDLDTQMEVYGAALSGVNKQNALMLQMKRATRPEKTLASMKEGKGINMSDPDIAEEFTRFMKETDPKGTKELEQKLQLENFKTKDRSENADGGRIGLKAGMTKRAFLKLMGAGVAGVGAVKSGIFSIGKGATKQAAKEVAQQTTSGTPPPYFFKLAEKIKKMGDDVTSTTERTISKSLKSKDGNAEYILEENMVSGDTIIKKVNKEGDDMITDVQIMEYRMGEPVKTVDGKVVTTPNEYEEVTEVNKRIYKDDYNASDYTDGIEEIELKKIIDEVDDQAPSIKYASGGLAYMLGE